MEAIASVRRQKSAFTTNFFASPEQIQAWIDRDCLQFESMAQSVLLFRPGRNLVRVYHVAESDRALSQALDHLGSGVTWVSDLVGSSEDLATEHCYEAHGFRRHASLVRMSRIQTSSLAPASDSARATFAGRDDLDAVSAFFAGVLEPYVDQIPDEHDLFLAIQRESLLIVRNGDVLGGVLLFEKAARAAHLKYWYVDPSMKNRGIGAQLMAAFLHLCRSCRRIVLWVSSDNSDAISKYEHYGFRREALVDRIMVREAQLPEARPFSRTKRPPCAQIDLAPETDEFHV
jgi:ribosomal protein S18 acetylase RimI-like enzyme